MIDQYKYDADRLEAELINGMLDTQRMTDKTAAEHAPQQTIGEYMECYYPGITISAPMMSMLATRLAMQGKSLKGTPTPRKGSD